DELLRDRRIRERRIRRRDRRRDVVRTKAAVRTDDVEQAGGAVAARFRHRVDDRTGEPAVFGGRTQSLNLDLLDEVVVVERPGGSTLGIARIDAVDQEGVRRK